MNVRTKLAAWALSGIMAFGFIAVPLTARASEEGRRNTTIGLGALTGYLLLRHKTVPALIAGGATAYAYKRYRDDVNGRHRRARARRLYYLRHHRRHVAYRHHHAYSYH